MHNLYTFNFLDTISHQLKERLDELQASPLCLTTLTVLDQYQSQIGSFQGVYVIYYTGRPVYVGKANGLRDRLYDHLYKLTSRHGINAGNVGYKALFLDNSMSTAANEDLLIQIYKSEYPNMWNGRGFGTKDPGKERDTTRPNAFDQEFPIIADLPIGIILDAAGYIPLGVLLAQMKQQLPYVFRYQVPPEELIKYICLKGVNLTACSLAHAAVRFLGLGWKGVILSYGIVIYKTNKELTL